MKKFTMSYISMVIALFVSVVALIILELNDLTDKYIMQVILGLLIALTLFFIEKNYELSKKINNIESNTKHIDKILSNSVPIEIIIGSENAFKLANTFFHKDCTLNVTSFSSSPFQL